MKRDKQFKIMTSMPATLSVAGVHPETKRIIDQIKACRGKVLSAKLKNPRAAKIRLDALRRARTRKRVSYKEGRRQGDTLFFRLP